MSNTKMPKICGIANIPFEISCNQLLYATGEIILDFKKKGREFCWNSCWNDVKRPERVECDFKNSIVGINLSSEVCAYSDFER